MGRGHGRQGAAGSGLDQNLRQTFGVRPVELADAAGRRDQDRQVVGVGQRRHVGNLEHLLVGHLLIQSVADVIDEDAALVYRLDQVPLGGGLVEDRAVRS